MVFVSDYIKSKMSKKFVENFEVRALYQCSIIIIKIQDPSLNLWFFTFFIIDFDGYHIVRTEEGQSNIFTKKYN